MAGHDGRFNLNRNDWLRILAALNVLLKHAEPGDQRDRLERTREKVEHHLKLNTDTGHA